MSNIRINKNAPTADLIQEMKTRLEALTTARADAVETCKTLVKEYGLTPSMILPELETTVQGPETPLQGSNDAEAVQGSSEAQEEAQA